MWDLYYRKLYAFSEWTRQKIEKIVLFYKLSEYANSLHVLERSTVLVELPSLNFYHTIQHWLKQKHKIIVVQEHRNKSSIK